MISFLNLNNFSVTYNTIKEEQNMQIFYFGCQATNLLIFYKHTTLRYYGNYANDLYPTTGVVLRS